MSRRRVHLDEIARANCSHCFLLATPATGPRPASVNPSHTMRTFFRALASLLHTASAGFRADYRA
jgi:hypothetical protein